MATEIDVHINLVLKCVIAAYYLAAHPCGECAFCAFGKRKFTLASVQYLITVVEVNHSFAHLGCHVYSGTFLEILWYIIYMYQIAAISVLCYSYCPPM